MVSSENTVPFSNDNDIDNEYDSSDVRFYTTDELSVCYSRSPAQIRDKLRQVVKVRLEVICLRRRTAEKIRLDG